MTNTRPAIVVSPGFIQNDGAFETVDRSLLKALEAWGYEVISLRSVAPRSAKDRFSDYVEAAADCVLALGARPVGFLGHSMGGLIGVSLPERAARRLSALVIAGAPLFPGVTFAHGPKTGPFAQWRADAQDLAPVQRGAAAVARRLGALGIPFPGRAIGVGFRATRRLLDAQRLRFPLQIWAPGALTKEELEDITKTSFATDSFSALADLLMLTTTDGAFAGDVPTGERLSSLTVPLLCIAGTLDGVAPPRACRALFHRAGSEPKVWHAVGDGETMSSTPEGLGHVDLLTSALAEAATWPLLRSFLSESFSVAKALR